MNLRAFENALGNLSVEVSSPLLVSAIQLGVPMLPKGASQLQGVNDKTLVTVDFNGGRYQIPFLEIRPYARASLKQVGCLAEEDSRNVLCNIHDIIAWD